MPRGVLLLWLDVDCQSVRSIQRIMQRVQTSSQSEHQTQYKRSNEDCAKLQTALSNLEVWSRTWQLNISQTKTLNMQIADW